MCAQLTFSRKRAKSLAYFSRHATIVVCVNKWTWNEHRGFFYCAQTRKMVAVNCCEPKNTVWVVNYKWTDSTTAQAKNNGPLDATAICHSHNHILYLHYSLYCAMNWDIRSTCAGLYWFICLCILLNSSTRFIFVFFSLNVCDYINLWKPKSSMPDYLFYPCRVSACSMRE